MMPWLQRSGLAPLCCGRVQDESGGGEWPGCLGVLIKSAAIPNFSPVHNLINSDWNVPVPALAPSAGPAHFSFELNPSKKLELESPVQHPAGSWTTVLFHYFTPSPSCHVRQVVNCESWEIVMRDSYPLLVHILKLYILKYLLYIILISGPSYHGHESGHPEMRLVKLFIYFFSSNILLGLSASPAGATHNKWPF